MKGYAGGRLFDTRTSPFGVALTPVQCLHYALTRPAVASVLVATTLPPMWTPPWPMRPPPRRSGTTPACWPRHPAMPTPASAPIAVTAPPARRASTLPWSTSSTTWPPCSRRSPPRCGPTTQALSATAADCIACGGCETRCPFGVPVVERMEKAKALLG